MLRMRRKRRSMAVLSKDDFEFRQAITSSLSFNMQAAKQTNNAGECTLERLRRQWRHVEI
jgi:hypothetical protein